jgi:hypothetical protein
MKEGRRIGEGMAMVSSQKSLKKSQSDTLSMAVASAFLSRRSFTTSGLTFSSKIW